ncbi:hypothetical protein P8452_25528 [Trifolium repens]|nr:hypothetical protein P8452_25528 [Trifolium repens]
MTDKVYCLDCCSFTTSTSVKIYMNYSHQQGCDEDLYIMQAAAVRLEWLNARRENEVGTVIDSLNRAR